MPGATDEDDDWVRQLLASHEVDPMPDDVLARLEQAMARVAAEDAVRVGPPAAPGLGPRPGGRGRSGQTAAPGGVPGGTGSSAAGAPGNVRALAGGRRERRREEASDRRRQRGRRLLPVAAGVAVLGLAAVTFDQLLGDDQQEAAFTETASDSSAAGAQAPAPRGLVATGTDYTSSDPEAFRAQVDALVEVATGEVLADGAASAPEALAEAGEAAGSPAPEAAPGAAGSGPGLDGADARSALPETPLSDPAAYSRCAMDVTDGDTVDPVAIDLATVDGIERAVVVVPDRSGEGWFVYVTDPECDVSAGLEFYPVTP